MSLLALAARPQVYSLTGELRSLMSCGTAKRKEKGEKKHSKLAVLGDRLTMGAEGNESGMTSRFLASINVLLMEHERRPGWLYLKRGQMDVLVGDMLSLKCFETSKDMKQATGYLRSATAFLSASPASSPHCLQPWEVCLQQTSPFAFGFRLGLFNGEQLQRIKGGKGVRQVFTYLVLPCRVAG